MNTIPENTALPFLTCDIPPVAGLVKARCEDFIVEEVPAYPACGDGDHLYFFLEKKGLTTLDLLRKLAYATGRRDRDFGYAGLKDSRAITRQWFSLEHADEGQIRALSIPDVKVLKIGRHRNKIKLGHLSGNRFSIKLRQTPVDGRKQAEQCLSVLLKRGVPNYFGVQRFGVRGDNWMLGRAIVADDAQAFLDQFCGRATSADRDMVAKARDLYDRGQYELSAEVWPGFFRDNKRACRILAGGRPNAVRKAFESVDSRLTRLFISAYQSYLFNRVLAQRIQEIDAIEEGDLAYKHINGAMFTVTDAAAEQSRVAAFEISPSGPLYGYRMAEPQGRVGAIEEEVLRAEGLQPEIFRNIPEHKVKGSRRPLRVPIADLNIGEGKDDAGRYLLLEFAMPSGAYATAVLRELIKDPQVGRQIGMEE
jgi:tRNA pseudouridine13 synthase